MFVDAICSAAPMEEITRIKFGAVSQPKAVDSSPSRRLDVALANLAKGAQQGTHKSKRTLKNCIINELTKASSGDVFPTPLARRKSWSELQPLLDDGLRTLPRNWVHEVSYSTVTTRGMSKRIFVKFVSDPNNDPMKTIVGLACASRAVADGLDVNVFFAAAGVRLLEASYIEGLEAELDSPEPMVRPMMDALVAGATFTPFVWFTQGRVLGISEGPVPWSLTTKFRGVAPRGHRTVNGLRRATHVLRHTRPARHLRTPLRWGKTREHGGNSGTQRRQHQEGNRSHAHSPQNRNLCIAAHIDHGKTALSDNLIAGAGMMSNELAGAARSGL